MPSTQPPTDSASSSITAMEPTNGQGDVEAQGSSSRSPIISHFKLLLDQGGVTPEVIAWRWSGKGTEEDPFLVDYIDNDPKNPMKFSQLKRWSIMMVQAVAVLAVAFVSTAYSGGVVEIIREFKIDTIIAILGVSLFVTGFAVGPLIWAPLSEMYGRQFLFFGTYMALTAFNAGAAGSRNIETLIILRFLAGTFGASPMTNAGGVIADMFTAHERGMATAVFATAPFLGPSIGPIAAGFLGEAAGWRWIEGLMAAFTGLLWIIVSLTVPETYTPVILRRRAEKLTKLTGKVHISMLDAGKPKKTVSQEFKVALSRPWKLLFREPIVFLTALYMAIVYGTLYMMFAAFPIVFRQQRGWSAGVSGLAFLGVLVGMMASVTYSMFDNKRYARVSEAHGGNAPPEARLPPAIIGSVLLPIGLFWFAWTNGLNVHWIVPIIGSAFFGAGLVLVFLSLMNYLVDSYVVFAASVLASNAVLRSLLGAAFPLFTTDMYRNLGIHWASTIPAFLSLACLPFPFLFWKYGGGIRMKCKYAAEAAKVLEQFRAMQEGREEQPSSQPMEQKKEEDKDDVVVVTAKNVSGADDDSNTLNNPDGGRAEESYDKEKLSS
ncbi:major facilitator superfamily domain-containing protein [Apiospora rasikravindrae]|uniref:Major facilitator superfamily domain-containing protein n=1 Tax=Apiospora rasikravindrae TaxID=990691 RepID=A0ABR1SK92_9PEZI